MPLTEPDYDFKYLVCGCGRHFNDYPGYYDHINDCPLLRCCYCLEWIVNESAEHVCAAIKLTKLKLDRINKVIPGRIRIHFSPDGTLPKGVVTREGVTPIRGWYSITPNGIAHRGHCWHCSLILAKSWLHNFGRDAEFWFNLKRD